MSRLETWEEISKRRGKPVSALVDKPELPEIGQELWNHYVELSAGLDRVTYSDIFAYEQVIGIKFMPVEARTIISIDRERQKCLQN